MSPISRILASVVAACGSLLLAESARADCSATTGNAWGDWWPERKSDCSCTVKLQKYACGVNGSSQHDIGVVWESSATAADCNKGCEDLDGFDDAVATALSKQTSEFTCADGGGSKSYADADADGYPSCIDSNDSNPRVWVKTNPNNNEICDGVDNDADGTVDEPNSICQNDLKRFLTSTSLQGDGQNSVNLIEGQYIRREVDQVIAGPHRDLVFARTYSSGRTRNDVSMGIGWVHTYGRQLVAMPSSGDGRYMVEKGDGEREFFRCYTDGSSNQTCVIDDHRPGGNLRRISGTWYYYPGNGDRWTFDSTLYGNDTTRVWKETYDGGGRLIEKATIADLDPAPGNQVGRVTKVETADPNLYFAFGYDTNYNLEFVYINSTSTQKILDFDVTGAGYLDRVTYASSVGTIDAATYSSYAYFGKMTSAKKRLSGADITVASISYTSDKATSLKTAHLDLSVAYPTAVATNVTYNIDTSPVTQFTHNSLWVTSRDSENRSGGLIAKTEARDTQGRVTCQVSDHGDVTKYIYASGSTEYRLPIKVEHYGKATSGTPSCSNYDTANPEIVWYSWEHNSDRQAWRQKWIRRKSIYSPASDCSTEPLPSTGCAETLFTYVGATDNKVQTVTVTGTTRTTLGEIVQRQRKREMSYQGAGCSGANQLAGLLCQVDIKDASGTVYSRTVYDHYKTTESYTGLMKTITEYKDATTSL
jgi:hypothetical protein